MNVPAIHFVATCMVNVDFYTQGCGVSTGKTFAVMSGIFIIISFWPCKLVGNIFYVPLWKFSNRKIIYQLIIYGFDSLVLFFPILEQCFNRLKELKSNLSTKPIDSNSHDFYQFWGKIKKSQESRKGDFIAKPVDFQWKPNTVISLEQLILAEFSVK